MKIRIENGLIETSNYDKVLEYASILNSLAGQLTEEEVRKRVRCRSLRSDNFEIGFGHNHMWIHEKFDNGSVARDWLVLVEFES